MCRAFGPFCTCCPAHHAAGVRLTQTLGGTEHAPSSPGPHGSPKWARLCHYPLAFSALMALQGNTKPPLAAMQLALALRGAVVRRVPLLAGAFLRLRLQASGLCLRYSKQSAGLAGSKSAGKWAGFTLTGKQAKALFLLCKLRRHRFKAQLGAA
jgi:hypothetical protein